MEEEEEEYKEKCPSCGGNRLIYDEERGQTICLGCGTVIEERHVDSGPEWRAFDHEEVLEKRRTGPPVSEDIHDKGLSTIISRRDKDIFGRRIKQSKSMKRLRKLDRRSKFTRSVDKSLATAISIISLAGSKLMLPRSVRKEAAYIYRRALENDLVKGRSVIPMVAGAVHIASRIMNVPRALEEISEAFNVSTKELGKSSRFLMRELKIKVLPADPANYVPKLCTTLGLSPKIQSIATKVINEVKKRGLTVGKDPKGTAAAAVYIACKIARERRTQRGLAEAAGVTEVTVRNRFKELKEGLGDCLDKIAQNPDAEC